MQIFSKRQEAKFSVSVGWPKVEARTLDSGQIDPAAAGDELQPGLEMITDYSKI